MPAAAVARTGGTDRPIEGSGSATSTFDFGSFPIPATDVGTAHFSHLGKSTYTLHYVVTFSSATAFTVVGTATTVAANGDMLFSTLTGTGTLGGVFGVGQTTQTAVAQTITGGTGRFTDATGTVSRPPRWSCQSPARPERPARPLRRKERSATNAQISGRLDLNQRPFGPQPNALPNCATPRSKVTISRPIAEAHRVTLSRRTAAGNGTRVRDGWPCGQNAQPQVRVPPTARPAPRGGRRGLLVLPAGPVLAPYDVTHRPGGFVAICLNAWRV